MIPDFKLRDMVDKIRRNGMTRDEALKMVWGWIKQDHLDFRQFKEVLSHVPGESEGGEDE